MNLDWKKLLVIGLGILSIVLIYFYYKNYEGFQTQATNRNVNSDTFVGSSALINPYRFNRSIVSLRAVYDDILDTITDYRSFTGIANATTYSYNSRFYNRFLYINDFSVNVGGGLFWFPFTGQYGSSANWLSNFASETTALVDLNVYNSNIDRYKNFIRTGVGENRQKFLFKRSLARPSLLYSNIELAFADTRFNINEPGVTDTAEIKITEIRNFDSNTQSWFANFTSYAKPNQNLYPPSDYSTDTAYKILFNNPKPDDLTFANVTNGRRAGTIVQRIPDYRSEYDAIINEELNLNVYGTLLPAHRTDFQESMFWGSVFANFDDQTTMDSILNVPFDGRLNGSELFYSFNLFEPDIKASYNTTTKRFGFNVNIENIDYNSKLVLLRSGNQIRKLTDAQIVFNGFKSNVRSSVFNSISFTTITSSDEAYVGLVTPAIMSRVPSLARRYLTSWAFNRSMRYMGMKPLPFTNITNLSTNDLSGMNVINRAVINSAVPANSFTLFLNTYASYFDSSNIDKVTRGNFTLTVHASLSDVHSEEACKRIIAGNRIYNTYAYNSSTKLCQLSRLAPTGTGNPASPLLCGTLFSRNLIGVYSATPAVVENIVRKTSNFKSLIQDIVEVLNASHTSLTTVLTMIPIDSIALIQQNLTNALLSSSFSDTNRSSIGSANTLLRIVSNLANIAKTVSESVVRSYSLENVNNATLLLDSLVGIVGKITNPSAQSISSITFSANTLIISIADVRNFAVGDLIEIKGMTGSNSYNGTDYVITNVSSSSITVTTRRNFDNKGSGGTVSVYSLYAFLTDANIAVNSISELTSVDSDSSQKKTAIETINSNISLCKLFTNFYHTSFIRFINGVKTIQSAAKAIKSVNDGATATKTDANIKTDIDTAINDVSNSRDISSTVSAIESIRNQPPLNDDRYELLKKNFNDATTVVMRNSAEANLNNYLYSMPKFTIGNRILTALLSYGFSSSSSGALTLLGNALTSLKDLIGTGTVADAKSVLTRSELQKMTNDYNDAIFKNKLVPDYGDLKNLNVADSSFLNSIAQFYYEQSDGLYEMTAIYDVFMIGSNMVDIRFDKKQRLPNSRINNLSIQYLPQVKEYNRLLDILNDGSWRQFYKDSNYTTSIPGQILKKDAIDFYYEDLSGARNALQPILNPIYPVNININVKDLQIQLSNYVNSNTTITKILTGKLSGPTAPVIAETATTVGFNYTDRLNTIQYELQEKIYTIETQISGILQGCARVFIHSISSDKKKWAIDGMALGIQAALTYNRSYNGNFEVDMGAPYGNIGVYEPFINYTKNLTPPVICGDLEFIKKAASIFNQTAFFNLSSFTTRITGSDEEKRLLTDATARADIDKRKNNFYDSNDGSIYVDKILGFQQMNSNTCLYRWVETQYDPLTNGPFFDSNTNSFKQRTVNVQYQFTFDNSEYQNPQLLSDNNVTNRPNEGFKYLPASSNVQFGDLYMSLYSWYASATRDLYTYLNTVNTELNTISNSYYSELISVYNSQNLNVSNYNTNQTQFVSTNLNIKKIFSDLLPTLSLNSPWENSMPVTLGGVTYRAINVRGFVAKTCDSITVTPPVIGEDLVTVRYNFRPGDANSNTAYNDGTNNFIINKYRDVPLSYFISTVILGPSIDLTGTTTATTNTELAGWAVNQNLYQTPYQCPTSLRVQNPVNCFSAETDRCKYKYTNASLTSFSDIMSNIALRDSLCNNILALSEQMRSNTNRLNTLMTNQISFAITGNIIESAGYSLTQLFPVISNMNDRITYLINDKNSTESNITAITDQYNTLLSRQRSDPNLRTYMTNREIPLLRTLPEEAPYLDDQNGACGPAYNCKSIDVIDQLLEQYNLDSNYDDTILRVLKAATPSKYQCDYLVEVRKKNVGIPQAIPVRYLKFIPIQQTNFDNRRTIYFNGLPLGFTRIPVNSTSLDLGSNSFTIDWHQYSLFDGTNLTPVLFSIGSALTVSYEILNEQLVRFTLSLNNQPFRSFEFDYNQLNRWVYFAIVRYNSIITCYKDGFAFISAPFEGSLNSLSNSSIFLGNDGTNTTGKFFKGAIQFFRYNNYDALYTGNFFNTVPRTAAKNTNTRIVVQPTSGVSFDNTVRRTLTKSDLTVELSSENVQQIVDQTVLTNGSHLRTVVRTDNPNSCIAFRAGSLYVSDTSKHQILKINDDRTVTRVIGTGSAGRSSSSVVGQDPLLASLNSPTTICEGDFNLYIADTGNDRICMYNGTKLFELITNVSNVRHVTYSNGFLYFIFSGQIFRFNVSEGTYTGYTGTTAGLINANLINPNGICCDNSGNLYVANTGAHTIVKITVSTGIVTVVAGQVGKPTNASNLLGDLGVPTSATLKNPLSVAVDSLNRILIADSGNNRLRIVMNSKIYTIVGDGTELTDSLLEGYSSLIRVKPQFVTTVATTAGTAIYINDSKRLCEIKQIPIPSAPPNGTFMYKFSRVGQAVSPQITHLTVGNDLDPESNDLVFRTDFTVQWFMFMDEINSGSFRIFGLEDSSNNLIVGVSADRIGSRVNISLTINRVDNILSFISEEITRLWVHCAIVLKGSELSFYKNGVLIRSFSNTRFNYTINPVLTIGNRRNRSNLVNFYGYITNFNILNGFAMNYNNQIVNYNVFRNPSPNLVVCLGINNPVHKDYSLVDFTYTVNRTTVEESYPYSSQYIVSQINLYNSQNIIRSFSYPSNRGNNYGVELSMDIGSIVNINQFNFQSGNSLTRSVQQWRLLGSQNNVQFFELNSQTTAPYVQRFGNNIYPRENSVTQLFTMNTQVNIGGDILTMTKRFNTAREIANCTMVITSNYSYDEDGEILYTPGVTSSNGFFIQDNTPFIEDSIGSDVSGYQFIGGALRDYNELVKNSFDPVVDSAKSVQNMFLDAYSRSRLDTYAAIGKLNTTGFDCASFQDYDTLKTYMLGRRSFTDTIFDSYPYSNAYMSNIVRFAIADSNMIDVIFTKQNLRTTTSGIEYAEKTTAGARYKLSVSQGFCDLSASFVSDITPFKADIRNVNNPLFNEYPDNSNNLVGFNDLNIDSTRGKDYKDRLNQRQKFLSGKRTPLTTVTTSTLPSDTNIVEQLTGLRSIGSSNLLNATENRVEYMISSVENLPIGKRCFTVQYVNGTEVNSIVQSTLETTSFKKNISTDPLSTLINTFRSFFNSTYSIANSNPFNSIVSKIYGTSVTNSILTLSVGVEYRKADNSIYYNKLPNIKEFKTELFYRVVFKNDGSVLAFEKTASTTLTTYTDGLTLLGGDRTIYVNNLLWKKMKFIPVSSSMVNSYSISQLEFYNNRTRVRIDSLSAINPTNFNLNNLIDGVNIQAQIRENVRSFTRPFTAGELVATFKNGVQINGFSFMTGYSYFNPQKWIVQGSCDGETFVELMNQNQIYGDMSGVGYTLSLPNTIGYVSFYRSPIFSFIGSTNISLEQPRAISAIPEEITEYSFIRIRGDARLLRYQLVNISLFNNTVPVVVNTTTTANTITYSATGPTSANENLTYLFRFSNINRVSPIGIKMLELDTSSTLTIQLTTPVLFNGVSFISGIDRDKCLLKWAIEVSANGTSWLPFINQETTYINDQINYPHYFCRTPIFYRDGLVVDTDQIPLYKTLDWPIKFVRFRPIYMYGPYASEFFELSQFEFFNSTLANQKITPPTSTTNDSLIRTNIIGERDFLPTVTTVRTQISNLPNYRGSYFDPTTFVVQFNFTSPINFDGFSFMSGSSQFTAVQLWTLEVSIDGNLWAMVHSNEYEPAVVPNAYPSAYYRLPIIYFDKNIKIISNVKYFLVTGDPSSLTNNGTLYPVNIYFSVFIDKSYVSFAPVDMTDAYTGIIIENSASVGFSSAINWETFNSAVPDLENVYINKTYPETVSGTATNIGPLFSFNINSVPLVGIFYNDRLSDIPPIDNMDVEAPYTPTRAKLYVNTISSSGAVLDTNSTFHLYQITGWTGITTPIVQGFINQTEFVKTFVYETNKPFDISLFRLIGPNKRQITPVLYTIVRRTDRFYIIQLNANIEVIGYSIRTTLYTNRSDPDSWKLYGMKSNKYVLLDKREDVQIPNERSKNMVFYFNKQSKEQKKQVKEVEEVEEVKAPNINLIKNYYKSKISQFSNPEFKMYMFDGDKTYYVLFDEYDNNKVLVKKNYVIGFVIVDEKIKKPVMYEDGDGNHEPFDLSDVKVLNYWKKHIGLELRFTRF